MQTPRNYQGLPIASKILVPTSIDDKGIRTLFDLSIQADKLVIYYQPCYLLDSHKERIFDHNEVFIRLNEPDKGLIKASRFSSAIESVGYEAVLDREVFTSVIKFIKVSSKLICYAINIHVVPFADRSYLYSKCQRNIYC